MLGNSQDLLVELRSLIEQLGVDGGLVSPSIYDTAQVLRLCPPFEGVEPGIQWLLGQQHEDGGWGTPTVPSARDIPTLAVLLTLQTYRHLDIVDGKIEAGLKFLRSQAAQWMSMHIDLFPIAGEMILPYLIEEAKRLGLMINKAPYERIFELRRVKRQYLLDKSISPNSAPTFSWEALGMPHDTDVFDPATGVGHSPSATAGWLHVARKNGSDRGLCALADAYLARAGAMTWTNIPGVMPIAYPITGFELCYGLYPLVLTGLINHPDLQDVVAPRVAILRKMVDQQHGLGFGEGFVPDVDDTSVAVIVLCAAKQSPNVAYVRHFWNRDHFYTYMNELNPSVYSNAHALHALVLCGQRCEQTEAFLVQEQNVNGGWDSDKWHTSWQSSTMEVVAALSPLGHRQQLQKAAQRLMDDQNPDGSWGVSQSMCILETTYSILTLQLLSRDPELEEFVQRSLAKGRQWLWGQMDNLFTTQATWLCKEVFSLIRVDSIYKLSALLSPILLSSQPTLQTYVEPSMFGEDAIEACR